MTITEKDILGWTIENPGKPAHLIVRGGRNTSGVQLSYAACGTRRCGGSVTPPNRWPDNRTCKSCLKTGAAKVWLGIVPKVFV